ncbi:hypothetical protein QF038_004117 [Pseudarthrobacter sp. W1I19]|uniref:hypothetical protein n=1 Tax=Pseudarthrobacter sp. W1I19 TaxID=3042288 RepID=UPI002783D730|nr:hypothetical protein [Pseudarthrobacter sp. W1I19]MDQ0925609.1 hypothetical protein [Pseudarthrobacter sp. W1I19]
MILDELAGKARALQNVRANFELRPRNTTAAPTSRWACAAWSHSIDGAVGLTDLP